MSKGKKKPSNMSTEINISNNIIKKSKMNFDLFNTLLSIISLVFSIIISIETIVISNHVNNFNYKMAQLNLEIVNYETPDCAVMEKQNITYTLTPYKIRPSVDNFSGSYSDVIFSSVSNKSIDMFSCKINSGNCEGIILNDSQLLYVTNFDDNELVFFFSSTSPEKHDILHLIFKGYNNEFYTYTMIFSTKNYKAFFWII